MANSVRPRPEIRPNWIESQPEAERPNDEGPLGAVDALDRLARLLET